MILPGNDIVSKLFMEDLHDHHSHVGPLALNALARQEFWILKGRDLAKSTVHNCVSCARANPQLFQQMMANLPPERVLLNRSFLQTGVDFCGPV
jgi:hypothetical protein